MTTPAWCSLCDAPTEHEPHPRVPYGLTCTRCGHVRVDRGIARRRVPLSAGRFIEMSQPPERAE